MSEFNKKKVTDKNINNNDNEREIPDIVTGEDRKTEYKKGKKAKMEHSAKHVFETRLHHHRKKDREQDDILEDLEFISEESVKDKSRMAGAKEESHHFASKKKTMRRSLDESEAKKEKSIAFMRRNIAFVGIGCLIVIVVICAIIIGVKSMKEKKAANRDQSLSSQEYETDQYTEINTLIENYYTAYASGNTGEMLTYANPISDKEKSYITMYSQYIEKFDNITCYTKTGADDHSFIVSVAFDLKYKNVDTAAPGLDFFYVTTNDKGEYYIDNIYSPFNLKYQENPMDDTILQLISDYQNGEDVIALQANVQTRYEDAVNSDENLKNMVEVTLTNAISEWNTQQQQEADQKAQEAAQQVAQQEQEAAQQQAAQDQQAQESAQQQQAADQAAQQQQQTMDTTETEQKAWVYATETMNIRQEPNEQSAVLASAIQGSELRQLAVTANGWSKVKTGSIVGYVKTEYVTAQQ
ncbi:SH3 domain-containing protein [uncultured Eubacterium sp.]|uniref:SH3 domain-containing protein n=1 Tax=uncultured Eubacterium sp. TaxID=165185 RepID=UPI0025FC46F7|nr:SH3 domain-containing protein [uncultured Eubacterium sp.]